jgi:hypothetical protein
MSHLIPYNEIFGGKWSHQELSKSISKLDNIRTGATHSHHCSECLKIPTMSCYENLHMAFCPVFVKDKEGNWVCHGQRFTVLSGGCGSHPRVRGYNLAFAKAVKNHVEVCIDDFQEYDHDLLKAEEDPKAKNGNKVPQKTKAELLQDAEADLERALADGTYDPNIHDVHKALQRQEVELERARAADKAADVAAKNQRGKPEADESEQSSPRKGKQRHSTKDQEPPARKNTKRGRK